MNNLRPVDGSECRGIARTVLDGSRRMLLAAVRMVGLRLMVDVVVVMSGHLQIGRGLRRSVRLDHCVAAVTCGRAVRRRRRTRRIATAPVGGHFGHAVHHGAAAPTLTTKRTDDDDDDAIE